MRMILPVVSTLMLFLLGALPAVAGSDPGIAAKQAEFKRFAKEKVAQLNRNLRFNKDKMEITQLKDGRYRARYHRIDDATLESKVNRSESKTSPFVGVLAYREQVFEAYGPSPEACRKGNFALVQITPNRHIFSYSKGAWR